MLNRIRGGDMSFSKIMILATASLLLVAGVLAQDPNVKHFEKDGLSFDYPAKWQLADKSSPQMQFLELAQGDVIIRVRTPREWLKTPEKEAHAKKLFQDQYVSEFTSQLEGAGMHPKHTNATTQIGGADAAGERVRAVLDGEPGGLDSYYRVMSDRLVNLSIFASDKDLVRAAPAWDLIRNSLKVEPPPQPKATPHPSPAKTKP
jgi:hypothetical protein